MNIIAVEYSPTTTLGGSERSYFDVLTGLSAKGHDVTLAYLVEGDLLKKYQQAGIKTTVIKSYMFRADRKVTDFFFLIQSARKLKIYGQATVYVNFTEALPLALLLKLFYGYKVVCHIRLGYYGLSRQIRWAGRWADALIVINKKFRAIFEEVFHQPGKIQVIYNGINIPDQLPALRNRQAHTKPLKLLYLGRIAPEKGLIELMEVLSHLRKRASFDFQLQITGDYIASHSGNFEKELSAAIEALELQSFIQFSSPVNDPIAYISDFDLFIFPSTWQEPFGRTIPESILAGTPVLARSVGMVDEIMVDNPEFIFHSDAALCEKIIKFYEGELLFNFEAARKRIMIEFNKTRMIDDVEAKLLSVQS